MYNVHTSTWLIYMVYLHSSIHKHQIEMGIENAITTLTLEISWRLNYCIAHKYILLIIPTPLPSRLKSSNKLLKSSSTRGITCDGWCPVKIKISSTIYFRVCKQWWCIALDGVVSAQNAAKPSVVRETRAREVVVK